MTRADKTVRSVWQFGAVVAILWAATATAAPTTIRLADDRQVQAQIDATFRLALAAIPPGQQVRLCFVESEPEDNGVVNAHLSHPLCLAQPYNPDPLARYHAARRLLDRAGIQFVCCGTEVPLFPITPIELRAGVVIGAERILTNRSGCFGWGDDSTAEVLVFDGQGKRLEKPEARALRQRVRP